MLLVCACVCVCVCVLPGVNHTGDVSTQTVRAGQSAKEVQVDRTEGSNCPIRTTTEDELICDGQTGGLGRLRTDRREVSGCTSLPH